MIQVVGWVASLVAVKVEYSVEHLVDQKDAMWVVWKVDELVDCLVDVKVALSVDSKANVIVLCW